jgi:diaminopimelate decarboxylase
MSVQPLNDSLSIRSGRLFIEGCDTVALARRFGTPLFVVSENRLRSNYRLFRDAFTQAWSDGPVRVLPSLKASPLLAIQCILTSEGAGCDVFGPGEFEAALLSGVAPELISVNGSIKDRAMIARAVDIGACIVLDSIRELDLCEQEAQRTGRRARVMLRVKPWLQDLSLASDYVPEFDIRMMIQLIKYGVPTSDLPEMARRLAATAQVDLLGVHAHMGRHSKRLDVWQSWVRNTVALTKELSVAMNGWVPRILNLGGGFPSLPDRDTDVTIKGYAGPALAEIARTIAATLRQSLSEHGLPAAGLELAVEPGRGIHSDTGIHLTTVQNVKHERRNIERKWAEVDTSQMFLGIGGANFQEAKFDLVVASQAHSAPSESVDVVGLTCNLELLFHQVPVPALKAGDVLALLNTGSYTESCARNFNALPRPGTVLVDGERAEWIKRAETVAEVFSRDLLPARLQEPAGKQVALRARAGFDSPAA